MLCESDPRDAEMNAIRAEGLGTTRRHVTRDHEWRCQECGRLVGKMRDGRLHYVDGHKRISLTIRGYVTAECWRCGNVTSIRTDRVSSQVEVSN